MEQGTHRNPKRNCKRRTHSPHRNPSTDFVLYPPFMRPAKHFKTILCQTFGLWALSLLWPESVKLPFHEHNPVNRLKVTHSQKLCHAFIVTWWLMVSPEVATEKLALACICLSLFSPLAFLSVWSHLPLPFVLSPSLFGFDTLLFVKVDPSCASSPLTFLSYV